jgi:hypothetical protein
MRSLVKRVLSRQGRALAAVEANRLLDEVISEFNESRPNSLVKVDEVALKNRFGERTLRKRFYDSRSITRLCWRKSSLPFISH